MSLPIVAIIGRPNVGKSTLFNKIIKKRLAITHDRPGVTRDRIASKLDWNKRSFMIVDTGGYVIASKDHMEQAVSEQSRIAIEESDVILLLVDVKSGITDFDEKIRDEIVKSGKPVVLGVNKIDRNRDEFDVYEFYNLGLGEPHPISGKTGRGSGDLLDVIIAHLPPEESEFQEDVSALRIALLGRPNVGKSSIVNSLTGKESVLVTDVPGTTRDSTDTHLNFNGHDVILVDTAGLKRVTRLKESLEYYSYLRTQKSLSRCDVAVIVIDIHQGLTSYDKNLIDDVTNSGKGLIVAANKWDLVTKDHKTMKQIETDIRDELPDKSDYPILFTSALTGKRVPNIIETALRVGKALKYRIMTSEFNNFIEKLPIPPGAGDFSILYGTQHSAEPPSFIIFVNDSRKVKDNFKRYLERCLREKYDFEGAPIKISFKGKRGK